MTIFLSVLAGIMIGVPLGFVLLLKVAPHFLKREIESGENWGGIVAFKMQTERSVATFIRHLATHHEGEKAEIILQVADDVDKSAERFRPEETDDQNTVV